MLARVGITTLDIQRIPSMDYWKDVSNARRGLTPRLELTNYARKYSAVGMSIPERQVTVSVTKDMEALPYT